MHSQLTDEATLASEIQMVRQCLGAGDSLAVEFNDSGWDSRIYHVPAENAIFKFPRSEKIRGRYPSQIEALKLAGGIGSPVAVPRVEWVHPDSAYFGYRGVDGEALQSVVGRLDDAEKRRVGGLLGAFLHDFHKLQLASARDLGLEHEIDQFQRWYGMGVEQSRPLFSDDERVRLHEQVYDIWPSQLRELGADIVLSHGDFHFDNILYGPDGQVGVIDFGDICTADASKDFADFGDAVIFDAALQAYGQDNERFWQKIRVREDATLVITLTAQLAKGDMEKALGTAERLRSVLINPA